LRRRRGSISLSLRLLHERVLKLGLEIRLAGSRKFPKPPQVMNQEQDYITDARMNDQDTELYIKLQ
jgi:hypothetical protein